MPDVATLETAFHSHSRELHAVPSVTPVSCDSVGRCKQDMAKMCVDAVLAVADLSRKDVNLDLIKVRLASCL